MNKQCFWSKCHLLPIIRSIITGKNDLDSLYEPPCISPILTIYFCHMYNTPSQQWDLALLRSHLKVHKPDWLISPGPTIWKSALLPNCHLQIGSTSRSILSSVSIALTGYGLFKISARSSQFLLLSTLEFTNSYSCHPEDGGSTFLRNITRNGKILHNIILWTVLARPFPWHLHQINQSQ